LENSPDPAVYIDLESASRKKFPSLGWPRRVSCKARKLKIEALAPALFLGGEAGTLNYGNNLMLRTLVAFVFVAIAAGAFQGGLEDPATAGRSLYLGLCQRCHGETGDATDYPGIIPLSGITLRLGTSEIASLSAPFVGRTFEGREAEALVAYLSMLKGEKGFEQPGHLFSPYLLSKKLGELTHYRIIDARPEDEYRAGHIPNAAAWQESAEGPPDVLRGLAALGVTGDTLVVVYDGQGGPQGAALWWAIRRAGHRRVALLDGGFELWTRQKYPVSASPVSFRPVPYADPGAARASSSAGCEELPPDILVLGQAAAPQGPRFNWLETRNEEGLLSASELRGYLVSTGIGGPARYAVRGNREDLGYLLFVLTLLGSAPRTAANGDILCLGAR
jgi:rhodanese-related sulfurtransferase/mono/diheme cytochrome c family protein